MATPQMILQSTPVNIIPGSPGSARFNSFNPDGTVLDIHTGYTVDRFQSVPNSGYNGIASVTNLVSLATASFDATGVTMSWTGAQATSMAAEISTLNATYALSLSNDSGSTHSFIGSGLVTQNLLGGAYA